METSSSRPYFAIFAIVAILVAAFILKQEYASANVKPEVAAASADPHQGLKESPKDWVARVGWQKLGFASQEQADQAVALMGVRRMRDMTPDQQKLLHGLLADKGLAHDVGVSFLPRMRNPEVQAKFLPEVAALYSPTDRNVAVRATLSSWCDTPEGKELVLKLTKDKNQDLAKFASAVVWNHDNPSGNLGGA
jgi:hypothetical protein